MKNSLEEKVLDAIRIDELLEFLSELVAIPSVNGTEQENDAQRLVAEQMRRWGFDVDTWELDIPALKQHPAYSAENERKQGLGVVGRIGAGSGKTLVLNGHVDVVPVDDLSYWRTSPWQASIRDGDVYGRGALDMKGGLCCALYAAKAIQDSDVGLGGRLLIQSVIAEEDGGMGTLAAILRGHTGDGAVVVEPTGMSIAPSQAGALNFRVRLQGKTAHGAMRTEGVSAIEKFIPLHEALLAFESQRNQTLHDPLYAGEPLPFALNIGNVRAGDWASNVPESLVFEGRFGVAPGEDADIARREFETTLLDAAQKDPWLQTHPPQIEWWGAQFLPAHTPLDDPIVTCVRGACQDAGSRQPLLKGMNYGADMRLLVNQGKIPTVLFGPGDIRRAHQPNEFVPIDDLIQVTRTLALAAIRFCGTA